MPLEARMYGMFAAFLFAWLVAISIGRGRAIAMPPRWMLFAFVGFIALMGLDGLNATFYDLNTAGLPVPYLYAPRLDLRLATGLLSGTAMAGIMLPIVNYSLWSNGERRRMLETPLDLATLLVWDAVLFALVVSGSGLFLYPLSLLGVLGVVILIGAMNLVLVLSFVTRNGAAAGWAEALNPFAASVFLSMVELGLLSLLRYSIFGTAVIP